MSYLVTVESGDTEWRSESSRKYAHSCIVIFLMLIAALGTSASFHTVPAYATCSPSDHQAAVASDSESYSQYGVSAIQTIYNATVCGSSAVASAEFAQWNSGEFVSVGRYKGQVYGWNSGTTTHYYYDEIRSGYPYKDDISSWSGYLANPGDYINFTVKSTFNGNTWQVLVIKDGSYTIGETAEASAPSNHADYTAVAMEQFDHDDVGLALHNNIMSLNSVGSFSYWTNPTGSIEQAVIPPTNVHYYEYYAWEWMFWSS